MKNIKLLLATTAILSTALAMNVKADSSYTDSAEITVGINLYNANKITVIDDYLTFGTLVSTGDHNDASVRLNATTGQRTIEGSGSVVAAATNDYNFAQIALNIPDGYKATLNTPSVSLENGSYGPIDELYFVPEYKKISTTSENFDTYKIGGSIDLSTSKFAGKYFGTLTITAVVEPE